MSRSGHKSDQSSGWQFPTNETESTNNRIIQMLIKDSNSSDQHQLSRHHQINSRLNESIKEADNI